MDSRTFSLRYRPQKFSELFDQEHIKKTLTNAIETNHIAHSYLFTGPRGVGKTTTARILAKSLNCEQGPTANPCGKCHSCIDITASKSLDVLEIDGASNRGIDQIRELRENIRYRPTSGKYRIYIIDEVHMLTTEAFNALLKTLEEPPQHVIFIFATTEPHKVPATILSRCQRFDFKRIAPKVIVERLNMILEKEQLEVDKEAVSLIADIADGGLRDAESILEQITTFKSGRVQSKDVIELLGIVPGERFAKLLQLIRTKDEVALLSFMEQTFSQGYDVSEFYFGIVDYVRALLFTRLGMAPEKTSFSEETLAEAQHYLPNQLARILEKFLKAEEAFKRSRQKLVFVETLALSLIDYLEQTTENTKTVADNVNSITKQKNLKPSSSSPMSSSSQRPSSETTPIPPSDDSPSPPTSSASTKREEIPPSTSPSSPRTERADTNNVVRESSNDTSSVEVWKKFMDEITKTHSFISIALEGSIAQNKGNLLVVTLTAKGKHHLGLLEHEKENIEKRISEINDGRLRLKFETAKENLSEPSTLKDTGNKAKKDEKSAVDDVLDIFKGEILR